MKKLYVLSLSLLTMPLTLVAQRQNTDQLDRGLVAVQTQQGVYCSWRIQADEYYDTQYNLYRDGALVNAAPLSVSNYQDAVGTASSHYTVKAVVRGVEQAASQPVSVWAKNYLEIVPKHDASLTSTYIPNDACCADVDGDGVVEILLKYDNREENAQLYPKAGPTVNGKANGEYSLFECLKMDGTVLWWVNCGPNMGDFQNNEQNIVGYDWDGDHKAEAVMRLAEGSTIHMADGSTYVIGADGQNGTAWTNYRVPKTAGSVEWFTYYGNEFLVYVNGETGVPYVVTEFPLRRLEQGESDLKSAWGDGYGHRASKFFFGAPYLDGQKPSIFLGRGIYTRHKFVALDVDPATHQLTERWRWTNNAGGPWYAQGYHNYSIADVDWDGRDEIVWGSMVIDDNGKGLSTTGLGHGDAHHVGDFNPYKHGQEGFFCNEDEPANNYRDLTTSQIYYRMTDTRDAGRALAGNFYSNIPGAIGYGAHDTPISTVTNQHVDVNSAGLGMNFRIYWDGDLLEECFDNISVSKPGVGQLTSLAGACSNNSTKATPCFQGDILGDWREEIIERTEDNNIRIFTTTTVTPWRNYSLWYDHQYRNAMVWQMCGYNQPPHVSYFLGELEGITMAPPPLTNVGRTVVQGGSTIDASLNDQHLLVSELQDATVAVAEGASPYIITFNVPSWVQGTARSECTTKETEIRKYYYYLKVTGGAFSGATRVVKQGDGILYLPNAIQTYTGPTDVWAGTLSFDGTMASSRVWLNRFAVLESQGTFRTIQADYASVIRPAGEGIGTLTADSLLLGFGARVCFDLSASGHDQIRTRVLQIEKKEWQNGPEYDAPVFEFAYSAKPEAGDYPLIAADSVIGEVSDIKVEGLSGMKSLLSVIDGVLTLTIHEARPVESITWIGSTSSLWDLDHTPNFSSSTQTFVAGDDLLFNDEATTTEVEISEEVAPGSVRFANDTKKYVLRGAGSIAGDIPFTLDGAGTVEVQNTNTMTGGIYLNHGTLIPSLLANKDGATTASLGPVSNQIVMTNQATLRTQSSLTASQPIVLGQGGGTLEVASGTLILNGSIQRQSGVKANLYKAGKGTLQLDCTNTYDTLYLNDGTVYDFGDKHFTGKVIVLGNATLQYNNSIYTNNSDNARFVVPEGKTATLYPDGRCDYTGALTGGGTLNLWATWVRCPFQGDWSQFTGTIKAHQGPKVSYDPTFDFNNTKGIGLATLDIQSGCQVNTSGKAFAIGALTGSGDIYNGGYYGSSTNTLTIGGKNIDFTFNGNILGSNISKVGTGTWTIANSNTMSQAGQLMINGGAVKLNDANASVSMTGERKVQVNDGGTLFGRGMVRDLNVKVGGRLIAGNSLTNLQSNTGSLRAEGSVNIDGDLYLNRSQRDDYNSKGVAQFSSIECYGALTINGTLHYSYRSTMTPAEGDCYTLLKAGSYAGNPTLDLQALPEGLAWDTSSLFTDGTLRVVSGSGIQAVAADDCGDITCVVFDIAGRQVAQFTAETRDEIVSELRAHGLKPSVYLVRQKNDCGTSVNRIILK